MYLFLDTSTPLTTIALGHSGRFVAGYQENARSHGPMLLPAIEELLAQHQAPKTSLTFVGCGRGPGSFTGIRIGMATAKAMAWGLKIPLVSFTGFDVLYGQALALMGVDSTRPVVTILDARRDEVYGAVFREGRQDGGPFLLLPEQLGSMIDAKENPLFIGSGVTTYGPALLEHFAPGHLATHNELTPRGLFQAGVLTLSDENFTSMDFIEPLYIRPSDAEKNRKKTLP
ncbi:tRNA (adenosine(37)-N6)-threonylcarbamoyltransferase complex dimerization subunit type 1 TsaB [Myxococcota bacterium]|nr:tRNA (adenosine(37)-N6)-threonylcarbamoyltransferase complex dimerization subunit type 1 TsaB [Myxococcota bacterium]MBU1535970.1 tRNA (adenosine(37)-N6)-threonylcarbamoyltransferase complex dimerization subunit type 1 TsaB [Myxococcota bacterium]